MQNESLKVLLRQINLAAVLTVAMLLAFEPCSYGITVDRALASVDDEWITLSDYQLYLKSLGVAWNTDIVDEGILKKMMEEKVLLHEAKRRGMEITDAETDKMIEEFKRSGSLSQEDLEKGLKKEGLDMQGYRSLLKDRVMAVKLVEEEVDSKVIVTDKEVEDYYKANEREYVDGPEKAVLNAIFLKLNEDAVVTEITDLKRKALKISAQLEKGESFEALVNQYGDDRLRSVRGRWGEFERGTLVPRLDRRVFSMKIGEVTEPLWVRDGAYILQLLDKTGGTVRPLKEVRTEVYRHLRKQKREDRFNEWMKTLWEKSSTKIN
ncbi:MAG TPA: peptidyl-prolyl cis-trans isomerase [Thermodesulfovibrionales bacterium]|nr:peptidyl-prolyl cis-trans isomerase [Thermodesulfovibrionales bacterium]